MAAERTEARGSIRMISKNYFKEWKVKGLI